MRHRLFSRVALAFTSFALPLAFLAACGVDGQTPDCSQPNSQCEPSSENKNPDATLDARDGGPDTSIKADARSDAAVDGATDASDADAADVRTDGDAKIDGDAKAG